MTDKLKSEFKINRIKEKVIDLLKNYEGGCNDKEISSFEKWIASREYISDLEKAQKKNEIEKKLDSIVKQLLKTMPSDAILPSENICGPTSGPNSDCDMKHTLHVDEFLYDDDDLEKHFFEKIKYCEDCESNNIKDTEIISHSLSRSKLQYLFNVMLPLDCSNLKILDVGSRIGAVLYGAYFYSNAKTIYGIEMNKELCNVQQEIIKFNKMDDRIYVIHDDVLNQGDIIDTFDIVILNNVFEFFLESNQQIVIWRFLKNNLKKNCLVVTIPSVEETFVSLDIYEEFSNWLKLIPVHQHENGLLLDDDIEADFHDMYLYVIK
ncbi:uncharacterized protein LOC143916056 [Arctopsyche grandis]|uniref:uncharacterized protein LOC143916056 n=1 Tax=Arctopsyche grandis TaxID=121162 RepID=UPI00406D6AB8